MKYKHLIILIILGLTSCNSNISEKLNTIDSLLNQEKTDSAFQELQTIFTSDLKDEGDRAFYNLLKTRTDYLKNIPLLSDTLINYSINYYQKEKDDNRLSEAYYYKGACHYYDGDYTEAVYNGKEAEYHAEKTDNKSLQYKIYDLLAYANRSTGNYTLALQYDLKSLKITTALGKYDWIAYTMNSLSGDYEYIHKLDSSEYYVRKSEPYINFVDQEDQAYFYYNISLLYKKKDRQKAKYYLHKSLAIKPLANAYNELASIYMSEGKNDLANQTMAKGMNITTDDHKIELYQTAAEMKAQQHDYQTAYELMRKMEQLKDKNTAKDKMNEIYQIQAKYDHEILSQKYQQKILNIIYIVSVGLLLLLIQYTLKKYKLSKDKKNVLQSQLLINIYNEKINALKGSKDKSDHEIKELKNKISELQDKQSRILYEGQKLFEQIESGETVIRWNKSDFIHFIEYYKIKDLPFVNHLENDYDDLSPRYKFFEILYHMGKDDQDVERILAISKSTIKSNRTRIKAKLIAQ